MDFPSVSVLTESGHIQDPPGQGPLQPALGDPASAGGLDWLTHRGPFQPQPFCDSVILSRSRPEPPRRVRKPTQLLPAADRRCGGRGHRSARGAARPGSGLHRCASGTTLTRSPSLATAHRRPS